MKSICAAGSLIVQTLYILGTKLIWGKLESSQMMVSKRIFKILESMKQKAKGRNNPQVHRFRNNKELKIQKS